MTARAVVELGFIHGRMCLWAAVGRPEGEALEIFARQGETAAKGAVAMVHRLLSVRLLDPGRFLLAVQSAAIMRGEVMQMHTPSSLPCHPSPTILHFDRIRCTRDPLTMCAMQAGWRQADGHHGLGEVSAGEHESAGQDRQLGIFLHAGLLRFLTGLALQHKFVEALSH